MGIVKTSPSRHPFVKGVSARSTRTCTGLQTYFSPTLRISAPGVYLIRVETRQTNSDHEHFSAIDLVVEKE